MRSYLIVAMAACTIAWTGFGSDGLRAAGPKHSYIAADSSRGLVAIVNEAGETQWQMKIGPLHDLHVLDNGHVLLQTDWTHLVEVDPQSNQTVWQYDCTGTAASDSGSNERRKVEVHGFQRLPNGNTLIAESGVPRIIEVDAQGKIVHQVPLRVSRPHPHRDTRLVRQLDTGNYLVCHEGDAIVREYSRTGETVWEYPVPLFDRQPAPGHGPEAYGNQCFAALRLANGNTLISTGNGHRIIEVTPDRQIAWRFEQADMPEIDLAWITTLQVLPNGNIVFGNCHAGEENPQVIEITREKRLVWKLQDFKRFGNALTNTQILSTDGRPIQAALGRDR